MTQESLLRIAIFSVAGIALYGVIFLSFKRYAKQLGLIDYPREHKTHASSTPVVGGMGIFFGFILLLGVYRFPLYPFWTLLSGVVLLFVVGLMDDCRDLSTKLRFLVQFAAAVLMIYFGGINLVTLGELVTAKELYLGSFAIPITIFATVGIVNAYNMIDGMDGLSGSLILVALVSISWYLYRAGMENALALLVLLGVGVSVFLMLNVRFGLRLYADVFLGDAGSLFLGFVICWFLVRYSQKPFELLDPVTALWIVAVPLTDSLTVMFRRMCSRKSPFAADRTHIHHILQHAGFSVDQSLLLLAGSAIVLAVGGIMMESYGIPEYVRFYLAMSIFAVYLVTTTRYVNRHQLWEPSS